MSSDKNYELYLGVCLKSITENSSKENHYDIYILDDGVSEGTKTHILEFQQANVTISFVDMNPYLRMYDHNIFFTSLQFSIAAYHRLFLPTRNFKIEKS